MDEQQLQQQIVQLVLAAMLGDQQATLQILQIMQAAQQGNQQAAQIAQMIQAVAQQMQQGQVLAAKFGAKLNHIKQLRGQCPEGTYPAYFKSGGRVCKKCIGGKTMLKSLGGPFDKKLSDKTTIDAYNKYTKKKLKPVYGSETPNKDLGKFTKDIRGLK